MKVIVCQDQERLAWDSYVEFSVEASQYHRWAYGQAIEETFGHRAYRLAAADNGEIRGILPLVRMRSHVFGDALISMPFASHGGIVADTPDAREALVSAVIALALELRADRIELRQGAPCDLPWVCTTAKVGMEVPLPGSAEELWNRLSSGTRNKIRSARKGGLRAEWGGVELLGIFYPIFAENMRNHGTPVYPRRWFEKFFLHGSGQTRILSVCAGGVPLGAGIATVHRRTLEWPWSAASKRTGYRNAGVFLYWSLLAWAIDHRFDCVDLDAVRVVGEPTNSNASGAARRSRCTGTTGSRMERSYPSFVRKILASTGPRKSGAICRSPWQIGSGLTSFAQFLDESATR